MASRGARRASRCAGARPNALLDEGLLPADREIVARLLADAAVNSLAPLAD